MRDLLDPNGFIEAVLRKALDTDSGRVKVEELLARLRGEPDQPPEMDSPVALDVRNYIQNQGLVGGRMSLDDVIVMMKHLRQYDPELLRDALVMVAKTIPVAVEAPAISTLRLLKSEGYL